jgi:hypothetical protein
MFPKSILSQSLTFREFKADLFLILRAEIFFVDVKEFVYFFKFGENWSGNKTFLKIRILSSFSEQNKSLFLQ